MATNVCEVEDADFRQVVNPSATFVLPQNATHGDAIQHFAISIPKNEYGLPLYIIRSDLLDWGRIDALGYATQDQLDLATEMLDYTDGYPVQKSGSPIWGQLTYEPFDGFKLFQSYLELVETEGIRLHDTLATEQNVPLKNIREMAKEYYWSLRARAYDLFVVAAEAKRREARIRRTESEHFTVAGGIINKVIQRINEEPELIKGMDAAELIDVFEKMAKVQRMSLGLVGQNASTNTPLNSPGGTVEFILRSLTQNSGLSNEAGQNMQDQLRAFMGDEATALQIQELIVRATTDNAVHDSRKALPPPGGDV